LAELVEDLIGDRILISPGRAGRPYDFRLTSAARKAKCPFCRGHEGQTPPEVYAVPPAENREMADWKLRVIPNLYPAVPATSDGVAFGIHEVVIETPRHEARLGDLSVEELGLVLAAWRNRLQEARKDERLKYGLVFKNQGPNAGASLEHPHSQFIALPFVPDRIAAQVRAFREGTYPERVRCEMDDLDHLVVTSRRLAAVTPAGSRFSYELWLMPKEPAAQFEDSDDGMLEETAGLLRQVLQALDKMLERPDYHLLVHTAPFGQERFWWRIELFPRLNRVAGFEWATGVFLNQVTPREATLAWRAALKA
jgi:UDPglucose--hexose-1-phosphate uridylyltransferase